MTKMRIFICTLLMFFLPASALGLPLVNIEGALGVGWYTPEGSLQSEGDVLDMENNFDLSRKTDLFGRVKIYDLPLIIPSAYVMVNPVTFNETTTDSFQFGGETFDGSLDTELKFNQYDIALYYSLPLLKTATLDRLNLEAGLNFRYIDAEASVSETGGGQSASESMSIIIPQIYLGAQFKPVDRFSFEAEFRGVTYKSDSAYSVLGRMKVKAFGPVFVAGGYRYDVYDIDKSGLMVDFDFSGAFIETGFSI